MRSIKLKSNIIKIKDLLLIENIIIPEYQRPYKWTIKNVNQLIDDIILFSDKSAYRLGTIVFHNDENKNNIVDGQQRYITIILLFKAILKNETLVDKYNKEYSKNKIIINSELKFQNDTSKDNIQRNYKEIERRVAEFDEKLVYFILSKCQFVKVVLSDITEAFQFFDSQNARGKDLDPHDLLKAFHLREMNEVSEIEKTYIIKDWETLNQNQLGELFNNYLFRIRSWSKGYSARFFTKNQVDMFKGISINQNTIKLEPYEKLYQMANIFVEDYNNSSHRQIDFEKLNYPFQLDQAILNGKRFFEMIAYYNIRVKKIKESENEIIELINKYDGKIRTGDKYVRILFDCALIFYMDKFGEKDLDRVIQKLFIWAYSLRLTQQTVQLASMDNYAIEGIKMFKVIREASHTKEVTSISLNNINPIKNDKTVEIVKKFKDLGYINEM